MIGNIPVAPVTFGVDLGGAPSPLNLLANYALPRECSVKEPGVIMGCAVGLGARDRSCGALFRRDLVAGVIRCRFCDADVTATLSSEAWSEAFAPAVPALPSASARSNELRPVVAARFAYARALLVDRRPKEAEEQLRYVADIALEAIAAGCDDPAGLARELNALRAEVNASRG